MRIVLRLVGDVPWPVSVAGKGGNDLAPVAHRRPVVGIVRVALVTVQYRRILAEVVAPHIIEHRHYFFAMALDVALDILRR